MENNPPPFPGMVTAALIAEIDQRVPEIWARPLVTPIGNLWAEAFGRSRATQVIVEAAPIIWAFPQQGRARQDQGRRSDRLPRF